MRIINYVVLIKLERSENIYTNVYMCIYIFIENNYPFTSGAHTGGYLQYV